MARPLTMQSIADAGGVSRMTVSLALRNSPKVSRETCRRLQALAAKMGYSPDPLIQRLTTHLGRVHGKESGQVIAWINAGKADAIADGGFLPRYECAAVTAQKYGYRLEEFLLRRPGLTGRKLSQILYQRGIEGLIIGPMPSAGCHLKLDWDKFSSVAIGYSMLAPQLDRVVNHQLHTGRLAIREILRSGYRRIGLCVSEEENRRVDHCWLHAFARYQLQSSVRNRVPPLIQREWSDERFFQWIEKERPDCVLAHQYWVKDVLERMGKKVPGEVAVAALHWPGPASKVAGVDQRLDVIGAMAVETLIGQLYRHKKGVPEVPTTIMVEGRWMDGPTIIRKNIKRSAAKAK